MQIPKKSVPSWSIVKNLMLQAHLADGKIPDVVEVFLGIANGPHRTLAGEAADQLDLLKPPGRGGRFVEIVDM